MIVEYLCFGDLLDLLRHSKQNDAPTNLEVKDFLKFAYDIASGMSHLAANNVSYR